MWVKCQLCAKRCDCSGKGDEPGGPGVVLLTKPGNTEVKRRRRGGLGHSRGEGGGSRETALLALDMGEAGGVQCVKRGKGFDSKWQSWELLASRL